MKLATLLYIKDNEDSYLLIKRIKDPNKDHLSPPGGKLDIELAESPAQCAVREAFEECSVITKPEDWKLIGIVTERNYPNAGNLMIFLMEYKEKLNELPAPCDEGAFVFVKKADIFNHRIPETDRQFIWDKVHIADKDPFFISLDCTNYPDIKQI